VTVTDSIIGYNAEVVSAT